MILVAASLLLPDRGFHKGTFKPIEGTGEPPLLVIDPSLPSCRVYHFFRRELRFAARPGRSPDLLDKPGSGVQEFSTPGLTATALAIPVMYLLASAKTTVADRIGSRALRADAVESIACAYLAAVVLFGLIAQLLFWRVVDRQHHLPRDRRFSRQGRQRGLDRR